ncbi:LysR substrate-binding domain-containing protein [Xylophilus sp. GOD-11R]|uniref:LysR substrate-binding domain-containing protein n=1 Tax=Xylophilus sp. GOD-11R TaxID=3089814 RepID=UPI00298D50CD|nr:LysR substrate-binding domain-containing protein [Xylophilus sp. GOD-11R]WPB58974.1 LysR substrate-binding domain-containing protein [Xylophilus sp. GOD-11R]
MKLPSLTALTMFEATARLGSFARAAEELSVSESAVCRQVIALEDRVGQSLFLRHRKRLTLTSEGARYAAEVRDSLGRLATATEGVIGRSRGREIVEVAAVPAFATQWLIPRTRDFLQENRQIQFHLYSRVDPVDLASSQFDLMIYSGQEPWAGYSHCRIVGEGESVAVYSPDLARRIGHRAWDCLFDIGLLHLESRPDAWSRFLEDCQQNRPEARLGHRFELFSMVIQAAVAGLGIALVPRLMVEESLASGALRELHWCRPAASAEPGRQPCAYFASWKDTANDATHRLAAWLASVGSEVIAMHEEPRQLAA